MALPPTQAVDQGFVREVDEELQRDRVLDFWKTWGRWLIGGFVGVIALWGGWLYWTHRNDSALGLEAEKLTELVENPAAEATKIKALTDPLAASDSAGTRAATLMTQASIAIANSDSKAAIALYKKVAADTTLSQPWRDLALIRQTATEFDTIKPEDVVSRLKPLAVAGNPWFGSAGELSALAYAKMGKADLGAKILEDVAKDETVPESIRARAKALATSIVAINVNVAAAKPGKP